MSIVCKQIDVDLSEAARAWRNWLENRSTLSEKTLLAVGSVVAVSEAFHGVFFDAVPEITPELVDMVRSVLQRHQCETCYAIAVTVRDLLENGPQRTEPHALLYARWQAATAYSNAMESYARQVLRRYLPQSDLWKRVNVRVLLAHSVLQNDGMTDHMIKAIEAMPPAPQDDIAAR